MGSPVLTRRNTGMFAFTVVAVPLTAVTLGSTPLTVTQAAVTAPASGGPGVVVTPVSPAPGTDIALRISGCAERTATAISDAFVTDAVLTGADGTLVGESRVRSSARPGSHDVRVLCGIDRIEGSLTVAAAEAAREPSSVPSTAATAPSTAAPASPVAPVRAGGGGTAGLVAVDAVAAVDDTDADSSRASGPGTAQSVTGLVLAAAAAVAVVLRGSRRRRGSD
jgi:hypothetical protein